MAIYTHTPVPPPLRILLRSPSSCGFLKPPHPRPWVLHVPGSREKTANKYAAIVYIRLNAIMNKQKKKDKAVCEINQDDPSSLREPSHELGPGCQWGDWLLAEGVSGRELVERHSPRSPLSTYGRIRDLKWKSDLWVGNSRTLKQRWC